MTLLVVQCQRRQAAHMETSSVRQEDSPMFSAGTLTTAGSIRLSARTKAPSSRVSSNIVAACVCSVEFMSFQDLRASGLRRLSTVSTMACNHGNKGNDKRLIFFQHFPWEKRNMLGRAEANETRNNCNGK